MSRFLLPTFLCGRQRKVGAAPHRGNTNRPLTNQGKAKAPKKIPSQQRTHRADPPPGEGKTKNEKPKLSCDKFV
ncbi:MAG: hypothetical protein DI523_33940 [Paraburkholderia fungorum]|nr:MAG: hypothetical protein DI523_33940 [Paraburkholderia fungorum]